MARQERKPANLECNNCGHLFEGSAWYTAIETDEAPHPIGWVPDNTGDATCPACGSRFVGFQKD